MPELRSLLVSSKSASWLFMSYSERTKCPACGEKVRLEDVRFTPTFQCPACQQEIQVSTLYQKTWRVVSWSIALLIGFILGRPTLWLILLWWVLFTFIVSSLCVYIVKYWLPPRLVRCASDPDHLQGLGLGPK